MIFFRSKLFQSIAAVTLAFSNMGSSFIPASLHAASITEKEETLEFLKSQQFTKGKLIQKKTFLILDPPHHFGFFCLFTTVLGCLDFYEKGYYAGLIVDFDKHGLYYDPLMGPNWWNYYFEPILVGNYFNATVRQINDGEFQNAAYYARDDMSRKRANELIQKYVKIKPDIVHEVDKFVEDSFGSDYILGIHYRGTDKFTWNEADFVSYEQTLKAIEDHLEEVKPASYKIFIATDEAAFLAYMQNRFPDKVVYQESQRSTDNRPVHYGSSDPYRIGREALVDSLLLSRTDYLIRLFSNLSVCSCYFNADLPNQMISFTEE